MIRSLAAAFCAASLAAPHEGDTAPDFRAEAALAGKTFDFSLVDTLRRGPVVVYFYPAAFTGGCSIQAHSFAVNLDKFAAAGASVVGVSLDRIGKLQAFSTDPESCAGKIAVASDADGRIAKSYELALTDTPAGRKDRRGEDIDHARVERTTFVIGRDGRIAAVVGGLAPEQNVARALDVVARIAK
jgi:thioredoxin-dependent peroxiredoxin